MCELFGMCRNKKHCGLFKNVALGEVMRINERDLKANSCVYLCKQFRFSDIKERDWFLSIKLLLYDELTWIFLLCISYFSFFICRRIELMYRCITLCRFYIFDNTITQIISKRRKVVSSFLLNVFI